MLKSSKMDAYKNYIEDLAKGDGQNVVFLNSGPIHASYVMENIFRSSKDCVKIYAGYLSGEVSGQERYMDSLSNFVQKGGKIKILLQEQKKEPQMTNPPIFKLLHFLSIICPDSIEVREATVEVKEAASQDEVHFTIGDESKYRLENNIKTFSASGNFNDPITVAELDEIFEKLFSKAKPVNLA